MFQIYRSKKTNSRNFINYLTSIHDAMTMITKSEEKYKDKQDLNKRWKRLTGYTFHKNQKTSIIIKNKPLNVRTFFFLFYYFKTIELVPILLFLYFFSIFY